MPQATIPPAAAPPAPAPAPASAATAAAASVAAKAIEEARALFQSGEVVKARERLRAATNSSGQGRHPDLLLELARTYDPNYLDRLAKKDVTAEPALAKALYEQAVSMGSSAAAFDMLLLRRTVPDAR